MPTTKDKSTKIKVARLTQAVSQTAEAAMAEYLRVTQALAELERTKDELKELLLGVAKEGKTETASYLATVSSYEDARVSSPIKDVAAVDALIAKFGAKEMAPFIKYNSIVRLAVKRKADLKRYEDAGEQYEVTYKHPVIG